MPIFLGGYETKLDDKNRIKLPSGLVKQIPPDSENKFILIKGLKMHLSLYPYKEGLKVVEEVDQLNEYDEGVADFRLEFYRWLKDVVIDDSARIVLPKLLCTEVGIEKDIILVGHNNVIDIWDKTRYESHKLPQAEYEALAKKVMGSKKNIIKSE